MTSLPVLLPDGFHSLVSIGDTITVGQIIASKEEREEEIVNISTELSIPIGKVKNVLKKKPGDPISLGEVIAVKKSFLGFDQESLLSKVDGIISRYERNTGNLAIRTSGRSLTKNIISPVDGTIALCDNKTIVVTTDKDVVAGTKAIGKSITGEVFLLEDTANVLYHLDRRAIGKIVVGGNLTREVLTKAIGIGAIGIVGTSITDEDLDHISQKHQHVPILEIDTKAKEIVSTWKDKKIFLDSQSKTIIFLHT
jgi:hypothetical protein